MSGFERQRAQASTRGREVFVALLVHGPDTAIVGVASEYGFAQAMARAAADTLYRGESEAMVLKFRLDELKLPEGPTDKVRL